MNSLCKAFWRYLNISTRCSLNSPFFILHCHMRHIIKCSAQTLEVSKNIPGICWFSYMPGPYDSMLQHTYKHTCQYGCHACMGVMTVRQRQQCLYEFPFIYGTCLIDEFSITYFLNSRYHFFPFHLQYFSHSQFFL